ncbi:hypothetical protein BCR35DRAFT_292142 [Leucosporidium creatinivorum]|uniref:Fe2OG dioxygenase domain-containing protein n=1 Tax=Leucosporidium creatinivorum TaxID=106004 RepID=A0A1Y2F102_9BASI|nr:hypothetical protein BCR35DRAFT_292142 [Leucosporidium creatinivorum]
MSDNQVPAISLRDFANRREEIKEELIKASSEIGFFTLVDHSIPVEHINAAFDLSAKFFDLPLEVKQKTPWNGKNMGHEYRSQIRPSTGYADPKESIQLGFGESEEGDMIKCWPAESDCPGFKEGAKGFMKEVQTLSKQILELLAEGVGLPTNTFIEGSICPDESDKEDSMSTLRLLKYHSCEGQDLGENYFRAGAHADFDILTLLFQKFGQDGLEVCPGRSISTDFGYGDKWTPIKITEGAIVCNIGDQLMRWSDDKLKSTFHRVTAPSLKRGDYMGDRYSIGFFNQARKSANMQGPLKSYPPITGAEFIAQAMQRNYQAALTAAKLQTYEISKETEEANKDYVVSGTGVSAARKGAASLVAAA